MSASWEITSIRDKRILLAIIKPPDLAVGFDWARNLRILELPPGSDFMEVAGAPFGPARNRAARTAVDMGYNLAFLDADLRVPKDTYMQLAGLGLDVVCGLYFQRFPPYRPLVFDLSKNEKGEPITVVIGGWKPGDLVRCTFIPTGMTYYKRKVMDAMFSRWPRPFEWGLDTSPIPCEDGVVPPSSEDFTMSYRASLLGISCFVMTGICGLHEVRAVIGPKWLVALPDPNPIFGVCGVIDRTGP